MAIDRKKIEVDCMGQKEESQTKTYNQTDRQNRQNRQGQVQEKTERRDKERKRRERRWQTGTRRVSLRVGLVILEVR